MFALAPKTPHTRLRNENNTQFGGGKAFPKTPLPSAKQILDSTQSGKPVASATTHLRKALLDKTPGTHLQNRGLKFAVQTPAGKTTVFIDQKPPSASRKSIKKPRVSAGFKTPNPATQKPYWDVDEADVSQEITLQEEKVDDDEPEYMPPTPIHPVEAEYGFRSGAELGKILNDMAHIPYHWYDDTPISFEEEAFFIPDDLLIVPLGILPDDPSFLSDGEGLNTPTVPPSVTEITKPSSTLNALGPHASRRPPQPVSGTRANARPTVATTKRALISAPAIPARRRSATTSALRVPLRTKPGTTAPAVGRSSRAVTKPRTGDAVTTTTATSSSKGLVPRAQAGGVKGKEKTPPGGVGANRIR